MFLKFSESLMNQFVSFLTKDCYADDWAIPDPMRVASVYLRQVQEGSASQPRFMTVGRAGWEAEI